MASLELGFHDYHLPDDSVGGAPLYYGEVARALWSVGSGFVPAPHDLYELVANPEVAIRCLRRVDTVMCNVGPYAHIYHFLREKTGCSFRIVRDAQTAFWPPYLFQEQLCGPLQRPGDLLVVPSQYARSLYVHLFPEWLSFVNVVAIPPVGDPFPDIEPRPNRRSLRRIGFLGRVAADKNFGDVLKVFAAARRRCKDLSLQIAGPIYPPTPGLSTAEDIFNFASAEGIDPASVRYVGSMPHSGVWSFLAGIDLLLSPAVSSNETFCRVLAEANHAGLPVVAAHHAAAGELLAEPGLVRCAYDLDRALLPNPPTTMGAIDVPVAVERILDFPRSAIPGKPPAYQRCALATLLKQPDSVLENQSAGKIDLVTRSFVRAVRVDGLSTLTRQESLDRCGIVVGLFRRFHAPRAEVEWSTTPSGMCDLSPTAGRLVEERLAHPEQRWALRNAMFYCGQLGFSPVVTIAPANDSERALLSGHEQERGG